MDIHNEKGEREKVAEYYDKYLKILLDNDEDSDDIFEDDLNMSNVVEDLEKEQKKYELELSKASSLNNKERLMEIYEKLGDIHTKRGEGEIAAGYYDKSLEILKNYSGSDEEDDSSDFVEISKNTKKNSLENIKKFLEEIKNLQKDSILPNKYKLDGQCYSNLKKLVKNKKEEEILELFLIKEKIQNIFNYLMQ